MYMSGYQTPAAQVVVGIAILLLFSFVPFSQYSVTRAQAAIPDGGNVILVIDCPCSGNLEVWIIDYASKRLLRLMYQPGISKLFLNYHIYGPYLLGTYFPGGVCLDYKRVGCFVPFPPDGTMSNAPGTGTSWLAPPGLPLAITGKLRSE